MRSLVTLLVLLVGWAHGFQTPITQSQRHAAAATCAQQQCSPRVKEQTTSRLQHRRSLSLLQAYASTKKSDATNRRGLLKRYVQGLSVFRIWRKMKKHFQRYTVYVLECDNNKFYVGSTKNRKQRFQEHQSTRGGSKWTRLHKPIRVLREYRRIPASYYLGMEAQITVSLVSSVFFTNCRYSCHCCES